jgi:hypothetical protein
MSKFNLSLLTKAEQRSETLARKAALLIHQLKKGQTFRAAINHEVRLLAEDEQEQFKAFLNKYKAVK